MIDATLKHKIGQMLLLGFSGKTLEDDHPILQAIRAGEVGGVILFDYDFTKKSFDRNIESPDQVKLLTTQLKQAAGDLPLLIGIDYEGGKVNRLKEEKGFPKTLTAEALGKFPPVELQSIANNMAETLASLGFNLVFAPVVDVNLNPNNPVIGKISRSFSQDPKQVTHCAKVFFDAYQQKNIISVFKHFPGHGSSMQDTHLGLTDVTDVWQDVELNPYRDLLSQIQDHAMVMTSHVVHRRLDPVGYPASLSYAITQKLLRGSLNFQGVVVTDDLQMQAISTNYSVAESAILAIHAGADLLVFGNQLSHELSPSQLADIIFNEVKNHRISLDRIEESYARITRLKKVKTISSF